MSLSDEVPNAKCSRCGLIFPAPFFVGAAMAIGNVTSCPRCGAPSPIEDIYDGRVRRHFLRETVDAFRSADIYELERFRQITERARAGEISRTEAVAQAGEVRASLADVLRSPITGNLLALVSLLVAIYIAINQERGDDVDHREIAELLRRQAEASEELRDEYRALRRASPDDVPPPQTVPTEKPSESRQVRRARERAMRKGQQDI